MVGKSQKLLTKSSFEKSDLFIDSDFIICVLFIVRLI